MTPSSVKGALYRLLAYACGCLGQGVAPDMDGARQSVGTGPGAFAGVLRTACDAGLLSGVAWAGGPAPQPLPSPGWRLSLKGLEYLEEAPLMRRAASPAAESAVASAVADTEARAAGL